MKLTIKNLGVVPSAEINLDKNLLIFTGENNSSKTYVSTIIHCLYEFKQIEWDSFNKKGEVFSLADFTFTPESDKESFYTAFDIIDKQKQFFEFISKKMLENIGQIFATSPSFFVETTIELQSTKEENQNIFSNKVEFSFDNIDISKKTNSKSLTLTTADSEITTDQLNNLFFDLFIGEKNVAGFTDIRGAINIFSKELSLTRSRVLSSLFGNNSRTKDIVEIISDRVNRYSMPIRESLKDVERYDIYEKKEKKFAFLADVLESYFFKGKISLSDNGSLLFTPNNSNRGLEIHTTSSTIKSLSPLAFYLRHMAQKGDFIIIDEPELNLHPDNQRKIARFFGLLINEGFKLLISTHSDYIVRELNNLIMLSYGLSEKREETERLLKDYGYHEKELLNSNEVGVYLFRANLPVENVVVDETGFSIETIDEEIQKLNKSSQDIYLTLFD